MVIKKIEAFSCGKVLGALYALAGLIFGGIFSLISLVGVAGAAQGADGVAPMLFGLGAIIILPVMYGIMGFIGGIIGAALYNVVASVVGGIELEIQSSAE
ncbi:MAG: hypothetical protein GXP26_16530 [Planctomycetes bacterium]|nr:hypothetical protein [Planctomycetota bacterium]